MQKIGAICHNFICTYMLLISIIIECKDLILINVEIEKFIMEDMYDDYNTRLKLIKKNVSFIIVHMVSMSVSVAI
jgi:hypothetical protein